MKYRNKDDILELPPIPEKYNLEFKNLGRHLQSINERAILKLKKIYKFMDSYGEFVSTFSVCGKGCAYCCYIDVLLSDLEAKLIEAETGKKRNLSKSIPSRNHNSACTFLTTSNECSIYNIRPFYCRTFHALDDPKYCKTGEPHQVYGSLDGKYTVTFYAKLFQVIMYLNGNKPIVDIRDFFVMDNI